METLYKKVTKALRIAQQEYHKSYLRIYNHREIMYCLKNLSHKQFNEWSRSIDAPKIWKLKSKVRKPRRSDIRWSNPCVDRTTHFTDCNENLNAKNSCYNCKKIRTTSNARPTICISSTNERKRQIGWTLDIGQRTWKWARTNNVRFWFMSLCLCMSLVCSNFNKW
jgi:hypothetical protein